MSNDVIKTHLYILGGYLKKFVLAFKSSNLYKVESKFIALANHPDLYLKRQKTTLLNIKRLVRFNIYLPNQEMSIH